LGSGVDDGRIGLRLVAGGGATYCRWVKATGIGDPAQAAGGDAGDPEGDAVGIPEFGFAVCEQADQRAVDVSEAKEAEVVGADENLLDRCSAGTPALPI
jgi:hypothetical protein